MKAQRVKKVILDTMKESKEFSMVKKAGKHENGTNSTKGH